jgi:hypothetical protein
MELAGSDLEFGPASKHRSRKSTAYRPLPPTAIDAMSRRSRCPRRDLRAIFGGVRRGSAGSRARRRFEGKSRLSY